MNETRRASHSRPRLEFHNERNQRGPCRRRRLAGTLCSPAENYPNPFNPITVVSSQWTVDSKVRLAVYDLLGREVAVLAEGRYPAGSYSFTFNATKLPSGTYFYRLEAGGNTFVKKMTLLR